MGCFLVSLPVPTVEADVRFSYSIAVTSKSRSSLNRNVCLKSMPVKLKN